MHEKCAKDSTRYHDIMYFPGQLPLDPASGLVKGPSIEDQTEQCLKNIAAVLKAAGSHPELVLSDNLSGENRLAW